MVAAQDSITTPAGTAAPPLSSGVSQVVELAQAQVNDATIVNYVQNSGVAYSLKANDIIYLKQQGVSDTVVNAMLNQHNSTASAEIAAAPANNSTTYIQSQTVVAQPAVTYIQPAPVSSVIIIPDSQTARYDHWYYNHANGFRYGNGFDSWAYTTYPAVSVSVGYGAIRDGHFHHVRHY